MSLPEFSVRQVVLVNILFVLILLAGLFALRRIPVDVFPDISFNEAIITTPWPGASPDEVERLVTTKIEDEIEDTVGIKELSSYSWAGVSQIEVEWDETLEAAEQEASLNELRAALDRVDDLPDDAEESILRELSVSEVRSVCMIAVADVGGVGESALLDVSEALEDRLERLPGLRKAILRGERERELRVLVDKDRALQFDLTLPEIHAQIRRNNMNIPAGSFTTEAATEVTVRGLGNFASPQTLLATVVKKNPDGTHVTLAEVADVVPGFETRRVSGRYNGHPAILIGVAKEDESDIRTLVDEVRALVEASQPLLPPGVETTITWDTSAYIDSRMQLLESNLLLGVIAVVAVLWFSVGFRNALLAILAVPFSFLFAFAVFPSMGLTINSLSLIGFIMVSGMLVDHAIIIIENIYRRIEEGEAVRSAIVEGTRQVMWPVIATVATTVAAFLPMLTISGTSGEFFALLPKAVIVTLLGSLLEALVILPAHYLDWGSRGLGSAGAGAISRRSHALRERVDAGIKRARDGYGRVLEALLRNAAPFLLACVAMLFCTCGLSRHLPVELFPSDFNQLFVSVKTPMDFGIEQTGVVMEEIERGVVDLGDEVSSFTTYVGMGMTADMDPVEGVSYGMIYAEFPNSRANVADPHRVLEAVRESVGARTAALGPDVDNLIIFPPRNGPPVGKPVEARINGPSYEAAKRVAEELKAELASIPGVYNIEDNLPLGPKELRVRLDEHRASIHGLSFEDVGMALRAANDGLVPSTFKDPEADEDVDIRVMLREGQRRTVSDLLDVDLRTPGGYLVKLGDVASIELERSYQRLYHYDAERAVVVYADVDNQQATSVSVNRELEARFADVGVRHPGTRLVFGGEFQETNRSFEEMGQAFVLALILIYAILAAQFRSYLQPLVVMSVVAFAFIGVVLGMWVMGYSISMYVIYAVIGLAGIVVNDSLVLLDFVNQGRAEGASPLEAVRVACGQRFRPILLTTLTTIAGLAPMALGLSGRHPVYGPFAAALVFGLAIASALTLFVVPALYLSLESLRTRAARAWGRSFRSSEVPRREPLNY
ncbi:MAG: efflux RND transporter permease subunit [Myxococcota bacterium]|nr:efflux RND transporter permease subunit [Myxococcota bacterium]